MWRAQTHREPQDFKLGQHSINTRSPPTAPPRLGCGRGLVVAGSWFKGGCLLTLSPGPGKLTLWEQLTHNHREVPLPASHVLRSQHPLFRGPTGQWKSS